MLRIPLPSATHSGAYIPEDDGFALCTVRGGEGHTHSRLYACTARKEAKLLLRGLLLSIALLSIWGASLLPIDSFLSIPTCSTLHAWQAQRRLWAWPSPPRGTKCHGVREAPERISAGDERCKPSTTTQ